MILVRLFTWAMRIPTLPAMKDGKYLPGKMRPPTFGEAITGVSMT